MHPFHKLNTNFIQFIFVSISIFIIGEHLYSIKIKIDTDNVLKNLPFANFFLFYFIILIMISPAYKWNGWRNGQFHHRVTSFWFELNAQENAGMGNCEECGKNEHCIRTYWWSQTFWRQRKLICHFSFEKH